MASTVNDFIVDEMWTVDLVDGTLEIWNGNGAIVRKKTAIK